MSIHGQHRVSKRYTKNQGTATIGHVQLRESELSSVEGAETIIKEIKSRRRVHHLNVCHNDLQDDGCIALFQFLLSDEGRAYEIEEITSNSNRVGDAGLLAIADYLKGNHHLKSILLQNNAFTGEVSTAVALANALNSSCIELLSLSYNTGLSDRFLSHFLPSLSTPRLRELHLSLQQLTSRSIPYLTAYISSPTCRLTILKCNGNHFGARSTRSIVQAIKQANFTLVTVEMYANHSDEADEETSGSDEDGAEEKWKKRHRELHLVLLRNLHWKKTVAREALGLLVCSRTLLMAPSAPNSSHLSSDDDASDTPPNLLSSTRTPSTTPFFPFSSLPTELKLHILSFLSETLTTSQLTRIFNYASIPSTLPQPSHLAPIISLPNKASPCIADPSSLPFRGAGAGCTNGVCMGAVNAISCKRDQQRKGWLEMMGCDALEREPKET